MHTLRVLHVIPSVAPSRGGPSKAVIEMVSALRGQNIDAEIATTDDDAQLTLSVELNKRTHYQGVPIRFFARFNSSINGIREFAYSVSFKTWIKNHITDYDVIHVHAIFSFVSSYTLWLARKHNIPYIVRPIGQLEKWSLAQSRIKKACYLKLIEKQNLKHASSLHFTAESERQQAMLLLPDTPSKVIPLGLNIKPVKENSNIRTNWPIRENVPTLCYLSRIHPKKGLELVLDALANMANKAEFDFQLIIAGMGDADYIELLKRKVNDLNLHKQCHFIGYVEGSDKQNLLLASDIYVLTSYSENFGIAVLEAMAAGLMPLVSKEVALSSCINEHQIGVTCDLNVQDIQSKLEYSLININESRNKGLKAKSYVEQHHQWSNIATQIVSMYQLSLDKA